MKISEELKRRIQLLEVEQEKQEDDLSNLEQLRDLVSIEELEQELATIDQEMPMLAKKRPSAVQKDVDIHKEKPPSADLNMPLVTAREDLDIDLSLEGLGQDDKKVNAQQGYVVCLMFNVNSPSEWSEDAGGGWRGKGLGTSYTERAEAEKLLQKLKQKWPDYPIELRKVK